MIYSKKYNLQPGNRIIEPLFQTGLTKHHVVFLGMDRNGVEWMAENQKFKGVRIITAQAYFAESRKIDRIERFGGSNAERKQVVQRALRDEDAYQTEAERRLALHLKKDPDKDLPGNRIKIIGYDGNIKYDALNHLRAVPGEIVSTFNNKYQPDFSVFIHAPFKEQLLSAEKDKNSTSIVFQARFKHSRNDTFICLAMFGGDADYIAWGIILQKTIGHGMDITESALDWDLFLATHHCSWTFFNDTPQEDNEEPQEDSLEILRYRRKGGKIIASSKKIEDNDDNPPHYAAKQEYIKKLDGDSDFYNTSVEPKESAPEPLVFEISDIGIKKAKTESEIADEKLSAARSVAAAGIIKKPWAY